MTSFKCAFGHSYYYNKFVPLWYTLAAYKARHSPAKIPMARPNKPDFAPKLPRGIYFTQIWPSDHDIAAISGQ